MADGAAGPLEVAAGDLVSDDFAIGASGDLYVTTHPENSVVRLKPSGERTTIAGPGEGAVGSTACRFGRAPGDETALYVTTDGGMIARHDGVALEKAKLLRIEVGNADASSVPQGGRARRSRASTRGSGPPMGSATASAANHAVSTAFSA